MSGNNAVYPQQDGGKGGGKQSRRTKDEDLKPEVDQELENGPIYNRHCTDILCCPIFTAFCVGMAWAFIYGLSNGAPYKLTTLFDYDGNGCGYHARVDDYPFILWPKISYTSSITEVLGQTVCVKYCPTTAAEYTSSFFYGNSIYPTANFPTNWETSTVTEKYLYKICIPTSGSFRTDVLDEWGGEYLTRYMADLYLCWWVCFVAAGLAFVFGFVYMVLIKF